MLRKFKLAVKKKKKVQLVELSRAGIRKRKFGACWSWGHFRVWWPLGYCAPWPRPPGWVGPPLSRLSCGTRCSPGCLRLHYLKERGRVHNKLLLSVMQNVTWHDNEITEIALPVRNGACPKFEYIRQICKCHFISFGLILVGLFSFC